jgi:eukaryotic-like serine/threonine-protein kinase
MLPTGSKVDRYIVEGKIGEGGMATVYRVRHETLGTPHALKVLSITSKEVRRRLEQEGRLQSQLQHENIVRVTDVLPDVQGQPGLLMEFVEGPSLEYWLSRYQPTLEEALTLFRGISAGIGYAHHKGLIHRDLKPANVLLSLTEDRLTPKVADFGLAKELDKLAVGGATRTGATMGTPGYMAPEQIRDASSADRRADLWSLGCVLYRLTCGIPPFEGDDIIELFNQVAAGDYLPTRRVKPGLPEPVHVIIERLLDVNRHTRLSDASVLIDWLDGRIELLPDKPPMGVALPKATYPTTELPRWLPANSEAAQVARSVADETLSHLPKLTRAAAPSEASWTSTPFLPDRSATLEPTDGSAEVHGASVVPATRRKRSSARPVLLTLALAGAALTAVGLVAVALVGAFWIVTSGSDPFAVVAPAPAPAPALPVVAPTPEPIATPDPAPAQPVQPARPTPPTPTSAPDTRSPFATVRYSGATLLWLESWDKKSVVRELETVPAGRYRIHAVFDAEAVGAGEVTLRSGQQASLKCVSQMARCRLE